MGCKECFNNCLVQKFVDDELTSIEGQLPAARKKAKELPEEREVAEGFYMSSLDDAEATEQQQLGREYSWYNLNQQHREDMADREVNELDSVADGLVHLGNVAVGGCSGPAEDGKCTGPLTEDFNYLAYMTVPKNA